MSYRNRLSSRHLGLLLTFIIAVCLTGPASAANPPAESAEGAGGLAVTELINRLKDKGVLSAADSEELSLLAEADAAEQAALKAQLKAAVARSKALEAMVRHRETGAAPARSLSSVAITRAPAPERAVEEPEPQPVKPAARVVAGSARLKAPSHVEAEPEVAAAAEPDTEPAEVARRTPAGSAPSLDTVEAEVPGDVVRVTYVPEIVKAELREQIKQEVLATAREENWAAPNSFPDWITKLRIFGDLRVRYEGQRFPAGNDNTGAFPNFNAINTGAPFDTAGTVFSPQFNVDQDRNRTRIRARMGAAIDFGENFAGGLRLATGENNSPVTQNQSLGAAGSGQGGNFSKYAVWLDRAFLKYEIGGLPDEDLAFSFGRFDNPFLSTTLIWADDLGFDGAVAQGRYGFGEDLTTFFAVGAFPVFNTDLNFATNQPAKFESNDKWLYGGQVGIDWELGKEISFKLAASSYDFKNIEGQRSTPFVPFTATDAGDTDASRPAFAQKGNTYMALRDITPVAGDAASGGNQNGTINQFQYFGLATPFQVMAADVRLDFNHFEPFQISLIGEYAKNRAFDRVAIQAQAVNNLGAPTTPNPNGEFIGDDTAWLAGITVGDAALEHRWAWNLSFGYRKVGSDAVVDGFNDSDFGGGGTNVKGFTFGANLALSKATRLGLRWLSASQVEGPVFKNDILQVDFSGKF